MTEKQYELNRSSDTVDRTTHLKWVMLSEFKMLGGVVEQSDEDHGDVYKRQEYVCQRRRINARLH